MTQLKTGILVYPDVEVLDFCGPYEVFSVTRLDEAKRREEQSPFDVFLVAESTDPVRTTGGLRVIPEYSFATGPPLDLLVVPGGWGARKEIDRPHIIEWIRMQAGNAKLIASVCTGSFLLGKAGLLDGRHATTHWMSLDRMRATFPDILIEDHMHWTEDGNVLTAAGISAGIDLALKVVARLFGEPLARATAKYMEFPYPESNTRRI